MALIYPAYNISPAQVVEVFEAAGRICTPERAAEISAQLKAGGMKPEDYIVAAGDADSSFCMSILRDNIEATQTAINNAAPGSWRDKAEGVLHGLQDRLARLEARAAKGLYTGPGTTHKIRNRVER